MSAPVRAAPPDPPAEVALADALAVTLPAAWRLLEARLEAQADLGSPAAPEIRSRLSATLALAAPTYEPAGREGAVTLVRPVAPEGHVRRVRVQAVSTLREGGWETRLAVDPPEALEPPGIPAETIPGRLVELGSEAERQWRAAREVEAAARQGAALAEQRRAAALAADAAEARRREAEADALAAARRAAAARALLDQAGRAEAMRALAETERLAEARRAAAEALEAATRREAAARTAAQRVAIEERMRQLARAPRPVRRRPQCPARRLRPGDAERGPGDPGPGLRGGAGLAGCGRDRSRPAADPAAEARVAGRDLRPGRHRSRADRCAGGRGLGRRLHPAAARGEPGDRAVRRHRPARRQRGGGDRQPRAQRDDGGAAAAGEGHPLLVGGVAQQGCSLMLRLSEVQTLDGIFGCTAKETPRLVARVALD
ncbi:hypothetical protein [Dankookia sp. P2]|uniref:hypothetical protein n=1 Tax=Dankookia sp. P2 TaxID=3423955 RepID=UPI003D67698C